MSTPLKGKVKWFDEKKGFGFIQVEGGSDVFVHYNSIDGSGFKTLIQGEEVEFETEQCQKGPQATVVYRKNEVKEESHLEEAQPA